MNKPKYSIIIPTLNEEKFLPKLLESLTKQIERDFEVLVVDGNSKDKTVALAKTFINSLPKLEVIVSKTASLPLQRNLGAKAASGEWLVFIDADSILFSYTLERCSAYISINEVSIFTSWCRPDSETQGDANIALIWLIMLENSIKFSRQLAPGPFSGVRREAFDAVGGYDLSHSFNEDVDFSLRLYKAGYRLNMIRETLYVVSFRRFRRQGTLKAAQQYLRAALPVILFKKPLKAMPGYIMGGQLYGKRSLQTSPLLQFEKKLKVLIKELF